MITLGATYKDRITGFSGVATGHVVYLTGCNQTLLAPAANGGTFNDPHWFDDQRLVEDRNVDPINIDNGSGAGADVPAPKR